MHMLPGIGGPVCAEVAKPGVQLGWLGATLYVSLVSSLIFTLIGMSTCVLDFQRYGSGS